MDSLPQAKEIERGDFGSPEFEVESFLVQHCQFRSLGDLRQAVARWEVRLKGELEATVNENYGDLAESGAHLEQAREALSGVRLEVLAFKAEVARMARQVSAQQAAVGAEMAEEQRLEAARLETRALLEFITSLDRIERLPPRLSDQQLVELGLAVEELAAVCEANPTAAIVAENLQRVQQAREDAKRRMAERVSAGGGFEVVMARARLCE